MAMLQTRRQWTREEVLALPDDRNRYELVAGELLVTPSPRAVHQDAVTSLFRLIDPYVSDHHIGHVSLAPADLELRPGEIYQPDLFVVPWVDGRKPRQWREYGVPLLVVEISSPSTARYDRVVKRSAFQSAAVSEYWIADIDARLFERWRPDDTRPEIALEQLVWHPDPAPEALTVDLHQYFANVWA
jgi:Uma2 family endonuclease